MGSVDEEIFEITDFTCVTDWERFVGDLESRIRDWQLHDESAVSGGGIDGKKMMKNVEEDASKEDTTGKLERLIEDISFGERAEFKITYVFPQSKAPVSPSKSKSKVSAMKRPTKLTKDEEISKLSHRLSAVLVATLNTGCDIPIFLQVADQWRWLYNGVCQNTNTRTYFEMIHLRNPPPKFRHLSGILDMFKEQVACAFTPPPPVKVSLRITYELREAFESNFPSHVEDVGASPNQLRLKKDYNRLPFGAVQDTVDKFYLALFWNCHFVMVLRYHWKRGTPLLLGLQKHLCTARLRPLRLREEGEG